MNEPPETGRILMDMNCVGIKVIVQHVVEGAHWMWAAYRKVGKDPTAWRRGWASVPIECPICGHDAQLVAPIGITILLQCSQCGHESEFDCIGLWDEPNNDGVWL